MKFLGLKGFLESEISIFGNILFFYMKKETSLNKIREGVNVNEKKEFFSALDFLHNPSHFHVLFYVLRCFQLLHVLNLCSASFIQLYLECS